MSESREIIFTNNAVARLAVDILPDDTTITIAGDGVFNDFPNPFPGLQIFKITVENLATGEREIMNVTEVDDEVWTVERQAEQIGHIGGPSPVFPANQNVVVHHRITAETLTMLRDGTSGSGLTLFDEVNGIEVGLQHANNGVVNPNGNGANGYFIPSVTNIGWKRGTYFVFINMDQTKTLTVTVEVDIFLFAKDGTTSTSFSIGPGGMATVISTYNDQTGFTQSVWTVIGNQVS